MSSVSAYKQKKKRKAPSHAMVVLLIRGEKELMASPFQCRHPPNRA
jgi:hypothetical protein